MLARDWIRETERNGWRVASNSGGRIVFRCSKLGCEGTVTRHMDALGSVPDRCSLEHRGMYAAPAFQSYQELVAELRRRRREIGLSQEDVEHAMGAGQGYINKLEAFTKIGTMPTLLLWAETVGLHITGRPAPLPAATRRMIENRQAAPYDQAKANFKHAD